jgi:hypothetical protein
MLKRHVVIQIGDRHMIEDPHPRKRISFRVQLSPKADQALERLSWETIMPKKALMSRVISWFCRQHPLFRKVIVGVIPAEEAARAAQRALSEIQ